MVQFNLLPDVKLEFVKTQRTKRLLTLVSMAVSAVSLAVLLLSFVTVDVVQKKSLHDLDSDIGKYSTQLKGVSNLDQILTVQNQLGTLTALHDKKPAASQLFKYISQVTPNNASLNKLSIDFTANTLTIGGTAQSLSVVSTFTDTLKTTTYKSVPADNTTGGTTSTGTHAFSGVVLTSFGSDSTGATFTITCSFDPLIFNTQNNITLNVPQSANADQSTVFGGGN